MTSKSHWFGAAPLLAAMFTSILIPPSPAIADDTAAHALAEKFAGASDEAKRKAAAKKAEADKARALEHQRALERLAEENRRKAEAVRVAAERLRAEEAEMLARARAEDAEREAARRADEERLAAERARRQAEEQARADDAARQAAAEAAAKAAALAAEDASRRAEEARRTAESERMTREHEAQRLAEERRELEAKRESEARELAAKLSRLREQRSAESASRNDAIDDPAPSGHFVDRWDNRPTADSASTALEDSGPGAPARAPIHETSNETHVTVLLIMEPGNRGIRRFDKSADPVLCLGPSCYIGAGATTPAREMTRAQALGPANTFGARAAACRHSLGCVFRDVDLGGEEASLQPVDLKIMLHDRREARTVSADDSCEIDSGRLYCGDTIRAAGWRAWIVPESLAARAGGELLQAAVAAGLPDVRSAALR